MELGVIILATTVAALLPLLTIIAILTSYNNDKDNFND